VMLAVAESAHVFPADLSIEATLSPRLRTTPLPVTPAGVADRCPFTGVVHSKFGV